MRSGEKLRIAQAAMRERVKRRRARALELKRNAAGERRTFERIGAYLKWQRVKQGRIARENAQEREYNRFHSVTTSAMMLTEAAKFNVN